MKTIPNDVFFSEVASQLLENKEVVVRLRGTSMLPLLDEKRHSLVLSAELGDLKVGDVVLFNYHGSCVLHRIRKISGEDITLQGDAVPRRELCTRHDVVAVLLKVIDRQTGKVTDCRSAEWHRISRRTLFWKRIKRMVKKIIRK